MLGGCGQDREKQKGVVAVAAEFENGIVFHHVGYVVHSIEQAANKVAVTMLLQWDGKIVHDPLQAVRVSFLIPRQSGNPVIELVEPAGEQSPVQNFLKHGGGLHHLCYEVDSLSKQLEFAKSNHDLIVRAPLPAAAFGGRRIAWIYSKTKLLVEYLERTLE